MKHVGMNGWAVQSDVIWNFYGARHGGGWPTYADGRRTYRNQDRVSQVTFIASAGAIHAQHD